MTRNFLWLAVSITLVLGLFGAHHSDAQPLRDRVLENVEIRGQCIVVGFSFPIQYVRHFPPDFGDDIRIRIRPSIVSPINGDALFKREAVRPPHRDRVHLSEVIYEGDVLGGPYLVLNFDRKVNFEINVGDDFRSMEIIVGEPGGETSCIPQ